MKCTQCGASVPDNAKFCMECGAPLLSSGTPSKSQLTLVDILKASQQAQELRYQSQLEERRKAEAEAKRKAEEKVKRKAEEEARKAKEREEAKKRKAEEKARKEAEKALQLEKEAPFVEEAKTKIVDYVQKHLESWLDYDYEWFSRKVDDDDEKELRETFVEGVEDFSSETDWLEECTNFADGTKLSKESIHQLELFIDYQLGIAIENLWKKMFPIFVSKNREAKQNALRKVTEQKKVRESLKAGVDELTNAYKVLSEQSKEIKAQIKKVEKNQKNIEQEIISLNELLTKLRQGYQLWLKKCPKNFLFGSKGTKFDLYLKETFNTTDKQIEKWRADVEKSTKGVMLQEGLDKKTISKYFSSIAEKGGEAIIINPSKVEDHSLAIDKTEKKLSACRKKLSDCSNEVKRLNDDLKSSQEKEKEAQKKWKAAQEGYTSKAWGLPSSKQLKTAKWESIAVYHNTPRKEEVFNTQFSVIDNCMVIRGTGPAPGDSSIFDSWELNTDFKKGLKTVRRIIIEDGITEVGCFLFCDCHNVEDVIIASSVKYIRRTAFCELINLISVRFVDKDGNDVPFVGTIESNAFYSWLLTDINISSKVKISEPIFKDTCPAVKANSRYSKWAHS